jgi:hypothetical protein
MIRVEFREPSTKAWKAWRRKAAAETERLKKSVADGEAPKINDNLYKEMKQVIFDAFHGKCAYCESKIAADQPGDVEHYRPKRGVTDERDQPVMITSSNGTVAEHPGYYWLAYDWRNLLPCCSKCNRPFRTALGTLAGKWNRFPVKDFRATKSGEEEREQPLLLNPLLGRPEEHLTVDRTGVIGWKTAEGRACVDLLLLNREALVEARRNAYLQVKAMVHLCNGAALNRAADEVSAQLALLQSHKRGEQPYGLAARAAIGEARSVLRPLYELLSG